MKKLTHKNGQIKYSLKSVATQSMVLAIIVSAALTIWAGLAPLKSAVVASGFVRVEGYRKQIQHYDGGIISAIHVSDGSYVSIGDTLITLATDDISNQLTSNSSEYLQLRLQQAQLQAQQQQAKSITFSRELITFAKSINALPLLAETQALLARNQQVLTEEKMLLTSKISQYDTNLIGKKSELNALKKQQQLFIQETDALYALASKHYISRQKILQIKQDKISLQSQIETIKNAIVQTDEKIRELNLSLSHLESRHQQKIQQQIAALQLKLPNAFGNIQQLREKRQRATITAPISGHITRLKIHTIGGTIEPGAVLMEIVPNNEKLIIEAHIKPKDIENIKNGQEAKIRLTAYNPRRTPTLEATVKKTSADRLNYQQGGHYYAVTLTINSSSKENNEIPLSLYPGMPAEIIIPTAKRSLFNYLFSAITNHANKAMREP